MLLLTLAKRNLWRNKKRTSITLLLIACSVAAMMMTHGLIEGTKTSMVHSATRLFPGDAQVHLNDYHVSRDTQLRFNYPKIVHYLQQQPEVASITARIYERAMISSASNALNIQMVAVDPQQEANVSKLAQAIIKGHMLSGNHENSTEILIGSKLAEKLEVSLGDRLELSAAKLLEEGSEIAQGLFRVSGIVQFNAQQMDKNWVYIPLAKAQTMLGMEHQAHELAFNIDPNAFPTHLSQDDFLALAFWKNVNDAVHQINPNVNVRNWPELLPELSAMLSMTDTSLFITGLILFIIVMLGMVNTLFMSIYERMWEFAVIKAIGNTPGEIFLMIITEGLLLALWGIVFGILLGSLGNAWIAHVGIDYSNMEFSGAAIVEPIRSEFHTVQYVHVPIISLLLILISCLYPARFASKIIPARALHKSL